MPQMQAGQKVLGSAGAHELRMEAQLTWARSDGIRRQARSCDRGGGQGNISRCLVG